MVRTRGHRSLFRYSLRLLDSWTRDRLGASAVYFALLTPLLLGSGVLAVDVGRLVVLRSQMQNAADATTISAAAQLDGESGARTRATNVAKQAFALKTSLADDSEDITISAVNFYSTIDPSRVAATSDFDALYVEVVLNPRNANVLLQSVLSLTSTSSTRESVSINASAVATPAHIVCNAPPLLVCDPSEDLGASGSLKSTANIGKQMVLKEGPGGGSLAPGNFGLLCPTEGNCGASNIGDELHSESPQSCYRNDVDTATGVKTQQIINASNGRFDTGNKNPKRPSRDIIGYPRDSNMTGSTILGNGNWDPVTYWNDKHPGLGQPSNLSDYTRYQVFLYEMGEDFARNGKQTLYPVPSPLPSGYTTVQPGAPQIPADGVPSSTPSDQVKRRVVKVAVLKCDALNVKGSGTYPTFGNFVEMFLTEEVGATPEATIYGELIGDVSVFATEDFHANVRLVE